MMDYLQQRAAPWVSMSVLAGGLVTALILLLVVRIETKGQMLSPSIDEHIFLLVAD